MPTSADVVPRPTLPKISTTQISAAPLRAGPRSRPATARPSSAARAASGSGPRGARRRRGAPRTGAAPRARSGRPGTAAGRRCCPTGPEKLPDWSPETRSGGVVVAGAPQRVADGDVAGSAASRRSATTRRSPRASSRRAGSAGATPRCRGPARRSRRTSTSGDGSEDGVQRGPWRHASGEPGSDSGGFTDRVGGSGSHTRHRRLPRLRPVRGTGQDVHRLPGAGREERVAACRRRLGRDGQPAVVPDPTARPPAAGRTCTPRPRATTSRCAGGRSPEPSGSSTGCPAHR